MPYEIQSLSVQTPRLFVSSVKYRFFQENAARDKNLPKWLFVFPTIIKVLMLFFLTALQILVFFCTFCSGEGISCENLFLWVLL